MKTNKENWILIANAHHAKIFSYENKKTLVLNLIKSLEAELDEEHKHLQSTFNSTGAARHGIEPHTDRRDVEKQTFADKIHKFLKEGEKNNSFEKLIILASEQMLGIFDKSFDDNLLKKVKERLPKNLVNMDALELRDYLREHKIS